MVMFSFLCSVLRTHKPLAGLVAEIVNPMLGISFNRSILRCSNSARFDKGLNQYALVRELYVLLTGLFGLRAQSLATVTPVPGTLTSAFVLWHGRDLGTRSTVHARLPAADVVGATL